MNDDMEQTSRSSSLTSAWVADRIAASPHGVSGSLQLGPGVSSATADCADGSESGWTAGLPEACTEENKEQQHRRDTLTGGSTLCVHAQQT